MDFSKLPVMDMQYPLGTGSGVDEEAGFRLVRGLKAEKIDIPVFICSSINYKEPEAANKIAQNFIFFL